MQTAFIVSSSLFPFRLSHCSCIEKLFSVKTPADSRNFPYSPIEGQSAEVFEKSQGRVMLLPEEKTEEDASGGRTRVYAPALQ
jgi:hypothetical protein